MLPEISNYLDNLEEWKDELSLLRQYILSCELTETFKWRQPCYTFDDKNIVLIHEFKDYCAISFFKGALLIDSERLLTQPTEHSQAGRQLRFTNSKQIVDLKANIKKLIFEAIEIEKQGLKINYKSVSEYLIPDELLAIFNSDITFKNAFYGLTAGRQKGYLLHFSKPKRSETKINRIQNYRQRILDGYGLNDCTCGLSKRKPNCDGSHKLLEKPN